MKIQMVDLQGQYEKIKKDIDSAILNVIESTNFINGPEVTSFSKNLESFLGGETNVIPCANGTDALQVAIMSLGFRPGDEIIVPSFTYVATAEVIGLLNLTPILVDVNPLTFNIDVSNIEKVISPNTKAIVPVHLFGQCCDMEAIVKLAKKYNLYIIEDAAQSLGALFQFSDGSKKFAGTIGDIGCTSFFPSKNLGCYGDGGAIFVKDNVLANKVKMITNHGQVKKYIHKYIGLNSRLDTIQAAILDIKLKKLNEYNYVRSNAANKYDKYLSEVSGIQLPFRANYSTHVFHQYTLVVKNGKRDLLKNYLEKLGIPTMVYYPIPLHKQEAFAEICRISGSMEVTEMLCKSVISLPMHTELTEEEQFFISNAIKDFFNE